MPLEIQPFKCAMTKIDVIVPSPAIVPQWQNDQTLMSFIHRFGDIPPHERSKYETIFGGDDRCSIELAIGLSNVVTPAIVVGYQRIMKARLEVIRLKSPINISSPA